MQPHQEANSPLASQTPWPSKGFFLIYVYYHYSHMLPSDTTGELRTIVKSHSLNKLIRLLDAYGTPYPSTTQKKVFMRLSSEWKVKLEKKRSMLIP